MLISFDRGLGIVTDLVVRGWIDRLSRCDAKKYVQQQKETQPPP